jgi:CYTH domain-containing protein
MYKNGVLQYKGINFWHVGCTDKQNKVICHIRIFLIVHDLMLSTQRGDHPHPHYIGRELTTDDHMFSNECSGRCYCYRYVCHAYKIVADIQQ